MNEWIKNVVWGWSWGGCGIYMHPAFTGFQTHAATWMNLEDIILIKISEGTNMYDSTYKNDLK